MRFKGTLTEWKDDRGFGFIEPAEGGDRVFCHIKAFDVRVRRPIAGDRVTYEVVKGQDGRTRAEHVRPIGMEEASYQSNNHGKNNRSNAFAEGENPQPRARRSRMFGLIAAIFIAGSLYAFQYFSQQWSPSHESSAQESTASEHDSSDALSRAFAQQQSNVQIQSSGTVDRILPDDSDGSRHQRFIVRLASGQRVLIAHNIDLAPRVDALSVGDRIEFSGEYEWNEKGGVVHWTHHDPQGRHQSGWLKHGGKMYQ